MLLVSAGNTLFVTCCRYAIMKDCWNHFPPKRPSFAILRHRLVAILDEPDNNVFVDQIKENICDIIRTLSDERC